ncbi:HypC/HybG/HupF family hydrogenase formation chaperone [Saccharomonospora viridis]|jgi:hydrogenase expression/formation protein HypC|uniref:Hydrogenase assembly chaperone HypC/HupF n=2 Tax=Saccharomonospora viridis TaxID=1852 RepID=C7MWK6_SACVD|nr:HypC/HybG/HupF family hydrogenase formation chaperone [Saccharomonospora viridis]ACU95865.1 hydrogenase assembly chaperone HypC/HupF [Saccharomonospora viridis DSM 43017]KHF45647.1 hydrogenase assembly protein HupF [Saccharomonospora viridis]SFP72366.1 hydrogenase expression/formation protein HypC [Saccharomonospora viridis]
MCLGIPGEVVELLPDRPDLARVNVSGVRRAINIGLLENDPPEPGDWVLIHVGFALSKIDEEEAAAVLRYLEELGSAYTDEMDALSQSMIE